MKKNFSIIFTALSVILILDSLNAVSAIFMFLLAGIIPGTDISISATNALYVFAGLIGFTLARIYCARFANIVSAKSSRLQRI